LVFAIVGAVEYPDCFALVSTAADTEAKVGAVNTAGDAAKSETALSDTLELLTAGGATDSAPVNTGAFTVALCCNGGGDTGGTSNVDAANDDVDGISCVAACSDCLSEVFETLMATEELTAPGDTGAFTKAFYCPDEFVGSLNRPKPLVVSICCPDSLDKASNVEGGSKLVLL
jgi:hypothetical protein